MNRRMFLGLSLLVAAGPAFAQSPGAPPVNSPQDQADIARVQAYLDGLHTLKGRFLQIAPDGAVTRGDVWLDRPGRMRFQYDPPSPLLLVAGHGLFVYYDKALKQTTNIPLGQTPLGILLADHVTLSGDVTVTQIQREPGLLILTLVFDDKPLALRQWIVLDAQRRETRVSLFDLQLGGTFDPSLFTFIDPNFFNRPDPSN